MRRAFTLIILLVLCAAMAVTAYAGKPRRHKHKEREQNEHIQVVTNDSVKSDTLLSFAQTLLGVRYRPASSDPVYGFDCSGFVNYVFKNFSFTIPRSSEDFVNVGENINIEDARPGDIILFKGTKSHHPHGVGHMGIVYCNDGGDLKFIHSTSGKEYCVTISAMTDTYKRRFVKVIRLLKQNDLQL
ncbi:NlpC/P60 family protein [Mucilaginibacter mallensis]|uniref:NlpC/P60 family protein n=1 Tax=Mucilaginibacter mallensis TaxID=652787 RepID=A0A1H1P6E5_MUCMA|nr:C40 family peptidase [Mucilaginibacter mallensis]SDS06757.1 NlpC/P60 family protein [Mucilaginibacter mallensis]